MKKILPAIRRHFARLGKKKSPAKASASKLNGAKGGRPCINKVDTP